MATPFEDLGGEIGFPIEERRRVSTDECVDGFRRAGTRAGVAGWWAKHADDERTGVHLPQPPAMATDAWQAARDWVARLFGRGGAGR